MTLVVMVTRQALKHDSANDQLTLTSRVGIVCQGWARWVSVWPQASVRARVWQDVSPFRRWWHPPIVFPLTRFFSS